jgi:uncharacterized membrane protein
MSLLSIIFVGIVMLVLLMFVNKLSKLGSKKPTQNKRENRSRFNQTEQTDEEENLPPGFHYAEPILQDLYQRNRINDNEFVHYNRFKPQDLAQILIDDRICTERELPMDLRRFLEDEE